MMISKRVWCAAIGVVSVWAINSWPSAAATVPSGEGWKELESENFIVFSNLDDAATQEIGLDLERLRAVLEEIFPNAEFESPLDTLIYVFRDRDSFEPYALPGGSRGISRPTNTPTSPRWSVVTPVRPCRLSTASICTT